MMTEKPKVNVAVIGVGVMGSPHARQVASLEDARLVAVCDVDRERAQDFARQLGTEPYFDHRDLLDNARPDAVIIATPHFAHTPLSIACLERGIHVLVEKPLAVHVNDGRKMIAAYDQARQAHPGLVFAIMFQQRTFSNWRKVKQMVEDGELGRLVRATWIITDWFRSQAYYDSVPWRGTWAGEGGGVLLNQCPHNLDLYQWFFGMPQRITGRISLGKYHHIEVEDEVSGLFEHENGMTGHFITSTAESPGTNRLEIVGERGRLVIENGRLTFVRNGSSMLSFIKTSPAAFDKVECQVENVDFDLQQDAGYSRVIASFIRAVQEGTPPVVKAPEGIHSLALANGLMLSHFQARPVDLPLDGDAYEVLLQELIRNSKFRR
jgi:predicted dehydrogenase